MCILEARSPCGKIFPCGSCDEAPPRAAERMATYQITELLGDGIAVELSESIHRVVEALPARLEIEQVDLGLEARRKDAAGAYDRALASMLRTAASLKY